MGCDVIDKIFNRGFEKGIRIGLAIGRAEGFAIGRAEGFEIGMDKFASLIKKLIDDNRFEDVKKASNDKKYRMHLLKEYAII